MRYIDGIRWLCKSRVDVIACICKLAGPRAHARQRISTAARTHARTHSTHRGRGKRKSGRGEPHIPFTWRVTPMNLDCGRGPGRARSEGATGPVAFDLVAGALAGFSGGLAGFSGFSGLSGLALPACRSTRISAHSAFAPSCERSWPQSSAEYVVLGLLRWLLLPPTVSGPGVWGVMRAEPEVGRLAEAPAQATNHRLLKRHNTMQTPHRTSRKGPTRARTHARRARSWKNAWRKCVLQTNLSITHPLSIQHFVHLLPPGGSRARALKLDAADWFRPPQVSKRQMRIHPSPNAHTSSQGRPLVEGVPAAAAAATAAG